MIVVRLSIIKKKTFKFLFEPDKAIISKSFYLGSTKLKINKSSVNFFLFNVLV